jgi:putative redox protein
VTAQVIYEGSLRTQATHIQSGSTIETDAPVDNGGQGARFSPTDLVAAALASCMCTIMGLAAEAHSIDLGSISCDVEKIMIKDPRRIGEIRVALHFEGPQTYDEKARAVLERAALTCPVFESLHADLKKTVSFSWS